jgi:phosphatidylglycerophosphatase A
MNRPAKRTRWAWITGTWFGTGLIKPGPGTWGSIAATLLWFAAATPLNLSSIGLTWTSPQKAVLLGPSVTLGILTAFAAFLVLIIGIPAATIVGRESGTDDPQNVVIDEVCGQWIALLFMPPTWKSAVLCLALFRIFDIVKPPPARQLERLHGGTGVMLDDVAAGIYALIVAQALQHWFRLAGHA